MATLNWDKDLEKAEWMREHYVEYMAHKARAHMKQAYDTESVPLSRSLEDIIKDEVSKLKRIV